MSSTRQPENKKGWEKRGPFRRRPKAGATPISQMATFTDAIELKLGPMRMVYRDSHWRPDAETLFGGSGSGSGRKEKMKKEMDAKEEKELRQEIAELREKNRRYEEEVFYLDFKVELLTDMLSIKTLEVEKLSSSHQ